MVRSRPPSGTAPQRRPSTRGAAARRSAPPPVKTRWWNRLAGRLGLTGALTLCALLACALFIPVTVYGAQTAAHRSRSRDRRRDHGAACPDRATSEATAAEASASEPAPPRAVVSDRSGRGSGGGATDPGSSAASSGVLLATLPWGSGDGQVGLVSPAEGLVRGPEALAVAPDGRIAVLDSVNRRVLVLAVDGAVTGTISLSLQEPRFLAVTNTRIYVLDCDADQRLVQMSLERRLVRHPQPAGPTRRGQRPLRDLVRSVRRSRSRPSLPAHEFASDDDDGRPRERRRLRKRSGHCLASRSVRSTGRPGLQPPSRCVVRAGQRSDARFRSPPRRLPGSPRLSICTCPAAAPSTTLSRSTACPMEV